jgi:hypothetical protein
MFLRNAREAVMKGAQIFFIKEAIPKSIRRLRLSSLPLTTELASALRRLRISTFKDLVGVSLRDFHCVSDKSAALFLELSRLIKVAAAGDAASLPIDHVKRDALRSSRYSSASRSPERLANARIELTLYALEILFRHSAKARQFRSLNPQNGPLLAPVSHHPNAIREIRVSPTKETIFIPQEARGRSLLSFPLSVRLQHVLRLRNFTLVGDLHGRTSSEIERFRNCGKKTLNELRDFVRAIQHANVPSARFLFPRICRSSRSRICHYRRD